MGASVLVAAGLLVGFIWRCDVLGFLEKHAAHAFSMLTPISQSYARSLQRSATMVRRSGGKSLVLASRRLHYPAVSSRSESAVTDEDRTIEQLDFRARSFPLCTGSDRCLRAIRISYIIHYASVPSDLPAMLDDHSRFNIATVMDN
ncbi:hypothetical protein OH76DRAFT_1182286 [Lentinus brumalis]|uniref:Uncharacterized protein n=1 Tax=Lentinus brumalis TaxID=2498619 RepID=A0A371CTY9_9APHY|nr:hypothetical protein OH76DRAFT_1182286 [Polyporus brumalis]